MYIEDEEEIKVSELFVKIYENFNVTDQTNDMKKLSEKELFLLLLVCIDKHSEEFGEELPVVLHNFKEFEKECELIYKLLNEEEVDNDALQNLINQDDRYICVDNIVDEFGNKLSEPLSRSQVRNIKINLIKD